MSCRLKNTMAVMPNTNENKKACSKTRNYNVRYREFSPSGSTGIPGIITQEPNSKTHTLVPAWWAIHPAVYEATEENSAKVIFGSELYLSIDLKFGIGVGCHVEETVEKRPTSLKRIWEMCMIVLEKLDYEWQNKTSV